MNNYGLSGGLTDRLGHRLTNGLTACKIINSLTDTRTDAISNGLTDVLHDRLTNELND